MLQTISRFILDKLGWKILGNIPADLKKVMIIVAPHTSNWDFILGITLKKALNQKINYVGKESLFIPPWGWIFRALGGRPVNRSNPSNQVQQVVDLFNSEDEFKLGMSPEGTRSKVERWRTGFYYITLGADVPLIKVAFDFENKEVRIADPVKLTGDFDADMKEIGDYYRGVKGKNEY